MDLDSPFLNFLHLHLHYSNTKCQALDSSFCFFDKYNLNLKHDLDDLTSATAIDSLGFQHLGLSMSFEVQSLSNYCFRIWIVSCFIGKWFYEPNHSNKKHKHLCLNFDQHMLKLTYRFLLIFNHPNCLGLQANNSNINWVQL